MSMPNFTPPPSSMELTSMAGSQLASAAKKQEEEISNIATDIVTTTATRVVEGAVSSAMDSIIDSVIDEDPDAS